ncbi:MAG TPA: PDR/VanB family oxidoreductase [Mycobacterium sp.]|nr:PDR/VanB family oxidoreductase [Mycobacterium sp.]
MRTSGTGTGWLPPPSVSGRFRHSPLWLALGAVADIGLVLLDTTQPARRLLNRTPRPRPADPDRRTVVVADRRIIAEDQDVVQLTLSPADGDLLPWHPGAHIDVFLPSGRQRQYSLCGERDDASRYRVAVRRIPDGGGGSVEMHGLAVGDVIDISNPRNAFYLAPPEAPSAGSRLRFIAGGIGITPILPMLALADGAGLDWSMVYTGRHRRSLPFLAELSGYGDRVTVRTDDRDGLPGPAELLDGVDDRTAVYVCGPSPMVTLIQDALPVGSAAELHYERFAPPAVVGGRPFTIELARTGTVVDVAGDETALAAIRRHRPHMAYSCQQGFCGRCVQQVLDGDVDHRDQLLTDSQRQHGNMLICVSRCAGSHLTLDI